jgi:16S rRNA (uracil1498-N3)-methyltransferase
MHKFFVPQENFNGNEVIINGEVVKHIYKVLRLKEGQSININNCNGQEFLAEIFSIGKAEVKCNIIKEIFLNNESPLKINLYQGLPKAAKMDLIAQKAAEIGVVSITPVITERVVVKNELGEYKKIDRWNRIALEASKQSKRTIIPKINDVVQFENMINEIKGLDLIVVPYEEQENYGIKSLIKDIEKDKISTAAVIIGPEGGFQSSEIEQLKEVGAHIVTLGPRILRTETAGFVCSSLLMYELGDMGGK